MNNINFGKPLKDVPEEELFRIINDSSPAFGALAQYELMRRLSLEDSKSSKRFAKWSLVVAVNAIFISLTLATYQSFTPINVIIIEDKTIQNVNN